jgi:hypothetical protein
MTLSNPGDCQMSAERCRREPLAKAGSGDWLRFSQAWEAIAAIFERLMATHADRGWRDLGARPRVVAT